MLMAEENAMLVEVRAKLRCGLSVPSGSASAVSKDTGRLVPIMAARKS